MTLEYGFRCPLPNGIHARPASALEEVARRFASDITLINDRTGQSADAKSVLGLVGLDIRLDDPCRARAAGEDAGQAVAALRAFVDETLPRCDDQLVATAEPGGGGVSLPPMLREADVVVLPGTPVVQGIGCGRAVSLGGFAIPSSVPVGPAADPDAEARRLADSLLRLTRSYDARLDVNPVGVEADILRAHRSVARDPELARHLAHTVRTQRCTAGAAIAEAETWFTGLLTGLGSALLRERALDIRDVCRQLMRQAYGDAVDEGGVALAEDSVCLAEQLTPAEFLALNRRWLRGLVLSRGGPTSHTVILARSFGIPTLVGLPTLEAAGLDGQEVVVDADIGALVTRLDDRARRYYQMERRRLERRRAHLQAFVGRPGTTDDGHLVGIGANIASAREVPEAVDAGADGVGLFRTEMLFLDRHEPPSEEEQFAQYRQAVVAAGGRPVILRTLDIGGDKPIPYLQLPREDNPFLGCRAVRVYPEFEALFRHQVRGLLRASAFGTLKVMVPMVARVEEASWVRAVIRDEQSRLAGEGVPYDPAMPVGAMIEVPSAAFSVAALSRVLDFFSIGTNDLLQYFMAADRANRRVARLLDPLEPSFLRLLQTIVHDAHAHGRWVGLCGEMGGQTRCLPLLVGLGLDEVSMAAAGIAAAKALVAGLSAAACRALVARAVECTAPAEVEALLDQAGHRRLLPLFDPALITCEVDCGSKEEAIKAGVDLLYATGRTDRPREVEDAVWRREAVYATGVGHGFAIPHAKTDAVRANSLSVVTLRSGVAWGPGDDEPVRVVILLAIRASDQATAHMKVLAALARRLMHDEFRAHFTAGGSPEVLCRFLSDTLGRS
jgi:fructose-specific PTS system IIA-like component